MKNPKKTNKNYRRLRYILAAIQFVAVLLFLQVKPALGQTVCTFMGEGRDAVHPILFTYTKEDERVERNTVKLEAGEFIEKVIHIGQYFDVSSNLYEVTVSLKNGTVAADRTYQEKKAANPILATGLHGIPDQNPVKDRMAIVTNKGRIYIFEIRFAIGYEMADPGEIYIRV